MNQVNEPVSESDWIGLEIAIQNTFTPAVPIDDAALFSGRTDILLKIVNAIFQPGRHVILHGSRGVGKSSIANVVQQKILAGRDGFHVVKRNCTTSHDYRMIWEHSLDDFEFDGKPADEVLRDKCNPYDIYRIIEGVHANKKLIFIIDEFDRVQDDQSQVLMADTIKYLADYASSATILIVGVADSVTELVEGHASIVRNVEQIEMPLMDQDELLQILDTRLSLLHMHMANDVRYGIVSFSQGLPQYTHLIGMNAALNAARDRSMEISHGHVVDGISQAIESADEVIVEIYLNAIQSSKPQNLFKQALLACALAERDERGCFAAAAVAEPYSKITGKAATVTDFARHLSEFTKPDRGPILIRSGKPKSYQYKFAEPLMRPYVTLRGVSESMIDQSYLI